MALFGLSLQRIINMHRYISWSGNRLIQYIYNYLQILLVSCFKVRKKRLVYLLGLAVIVYFFTTIWRQGDRRKFPLSTNFFSTYHLPNLPIFHSQSREDAALYERFYKNPPKFHGTIVEMGALDGQLFSISKFFEDYLGWTSILVEANPYNFKKLVKNRPHSIKYNTAICRQEHVEFVGSEAVGGIENYMSEKHRKGWIPKNSEKIIVNCSRLHTIFRDITHIDIFVLDVEGGELEALQTMNWSIPVDFWVIELDNTNPEKDRAVSNLLLSKGYLQSKWDIRSACVKGMDCSSNLMFSKRKIGKRVISYSLYDNDQRYTDGALENVELMPTIYTDWEIYIYHDTTVPSNIIDKLTKYKYVNMINMFNSSIVNKMSWCLLVASEMDVERYIIRNIDTRLSLREKSAVDDWITSGKRFHVMRDHPSHSQYPMNSGMWGGKRDAMLNMHSLLLMQRQQNGHTENMKFLNTVVWMKAKSSVYQHDSFPCGHHGMDHPFPTNRVGLEYVGSVYVNKQRRQSDVDILRQAMTLPSKCGLDQINKRKVVTDDFDSASALIHSTRAKHDFNIDAFKSIQSQCKFLNPSVFVECRSNVTTQWIQQNQPCSDHAFIRLIQHGFVSDNRIHNDVPGTIFTDGYIYKWQAYVREVPNGPPQTWTNPPTIIEHKCLASVLQPYPTAMGHFAHEVLPRLLYLLQHIPDFCPIVIAVSPFVQRYIALLPPHYQSRIVKWKGAGHVYYSDKLYIANEGPYCHLKNPHNGGMSTFYQPPLLQYVRTVFIKNKPTLTNNENKTILVIKREKGRRSYSEHDLLLKQLYTVSKHVIVFEGNGTLKDHLQLFHWANVVIGPHGAGFSNLVFCKPKTLVIEIGWDDTKSMEMDNMYSRVSAALGLNYILLIGRGSYNGNISLKPLKIISEIKFY